MNNTVHVIHIIQNDLEGVWRSACAFTFIVYYMYRL